MATSGTTSNEKTLYGLGGKAYKVTYTFGWTRTSYSVENNTSTISWTITAAYTNGYKSGGYYNRSYTVKIDGVTYSGSYTEREMAAGETVTLGEGSAVISHNADGTKTFSYSTSTTLGGISNTGTLDAIPRPASIVSAQDFNDTQNPTITYNNISGELVDSLEACISFTGEKDDVPYREISKTGTTYTFYLTWADREALRKGITSGNSRTVRFYVRTRVGDYTEWSYITKTLTLINHTPTLSPTVTDANPNTAMLTGDINKLVRYYSNANVVFGAAARKEATLTSKVVTNGSQRFEFEDLNQDSVVISGVEDNVFSLSVTDSRGYTTSEQVHFKGDNFIPYFKVTCAQAIRLNLDKTVDLTVKGKYYNGSFGAQNNELIIETRHNENGGEWSEWENITPLISDISDNTYTLNATISGYDPSGSYDFQCRARDKLSTAESAVDTVTLEPLFDWGRNDFNFNVPVTFEGEPLNDFVIETGTEAMGTNGTWYWRKWRSGRAECYGCRNYGNMAVTTTWGGLYRSATFTQELPFDLFVATPEVIDISLRSTGNYGGWVVRHEESAPSDSDSGSFIVVRPASATLQQTYISFNIIGRWK